MNSLNFAELKEQLRTDLAKESFKHFVEQTFPDYQFNWHHLYIIDKLQQFADGKIKKLMLFVPPQHGKSQLVSRHFPAWLLGINPDLKVVGCSYAANLAHKFNRAVQRIIDDKEYHRIFPDTSLNSKRSVTTGNYLRNTEEFEIVNKKGSYKSVGVAGPLTGNPMDIGIIDDPVKDQLEASSKRFRDRTWEWYTDVFLTRTHNESKLLLTMTRWHEDDLAGRILEADDDWEVIRFPAIKENDINPLDPRQVGDALWPERHSLERLNKQRETSQRTFESLYQQRPTAQDGDIFKREWFKASELDWKFFRQAVSIYVDGAYTTKESGDPSAIYTYFKHNNQLHVIDVDSVRLSFEDLKKHIKSKVVQFGNIRTTRIRIEGKGPGISLVQSLKKDPQYRMLRVYQDNIPHVDKEARAHATAGFIERGDVLFADAPWNAEYFEQMCAFPNAKHDDMVDCTTAAIRIELLKGDTGQMSKA